MMRAALLVLALAACSAPPPPPSPPRPAPAHDPAPEPAGVWWRDAIFYEIYPRSFQDSDGDGVGDLRGIAQRLDYLAELGVDALWITPFFPSPQVDFGYDVSDFRDVDPTFGSLSDFDALLAQAHARGMRVILDLVLNHTSDRHPWFVSARASRTSPQRDFYVWRDPAPGGGPPNNWASIFEPRAWTLDEKTGQYYYHAFYPQQPDLNWRNPEVEKAMHEVVRFWLDRGVDGFRLDAVAHLYEDPEFRDNGLLDRFRKGSTTEREQDHRHTMFVPEGYEALRRLRTVAERYRGERLLVSEAYTPDAEALLPYYGKDGGGVQLPFNFLLMEVDRLDARAFRAQVEETERALAGRPTTYVLGNHDNPRLVDRYGDGAHDEAIAKLLGLMLLTLRGAPFLYYGDEIGMVTTEPTSLAEVRDPVGRRYWPEFKGRDGERTPMQWDGSPGAGFTTGKPWLAIPASAKQRHVAAQRNDERSILGLYRRAIALRRSRAALRHGDYAAAEAPDGVFAYLRRTEDEVVLVALNMTAAEQRVPLAGGAPQVLLTTSPSPLRLGPDAVGLRPYEGAVLALPP